MRVYRSSTLVDLLPERQAVKDALGGLCVVVDSYVADERSVPDSCVADVASRDLYIGIVGLRHGAVPPGRVCSIMQLEVQAARKNTNPTLVFVKNEDEIEQCFRDAVTLEGRRST
jgi:Domain of unknown function (DUF4062)